MTPKAGTAEKTSPATKSAGKAAPASTAPSAAESQTPRAADTKRGVAAKAKQAKESKATTDSNPEHSNDATLATPETKFALGAKLAGKKTPGRPKVLASRKSAGSKTESGEAEQEKVEGTPKREEGEEAKDLESMRPQDPPAENVEASAKYEGATMESGEHAHASVGESTKGEHTVVENVGESTRSETTSFIGMEGMQTAVEMDVPPVAIVGDAINQEESVVVRISKSSHRERQNNEEKAVELNEEPEEERNINNEDLKSEAVTTEINIKDKMGEYALIEHGEFDGDEALEDYEDRVDFEDHGEDELVEDYAEEPGEESEALEDEHRELTAIARARRIKKEHEIFVGGLDRDATEDDLKKVFGNIGEVVDVRLHKNVSNNKNKGYAFVRFANKDHAKRALSEMKNPVIHGKRCGTAPSEDNDTLFVGNICNTWTKEAIKQKLKDYGVEGVENITLVADVQHEGKSRGFAFIEFSCHNDAMLAYKRLQKPDAIFGHPERTVKVAFAEPLREPDPEVMSQVKTVFLDGIPPQWDEDHVREQLKGCGEMVRVVLARNMSTAKRRDFGFVDFFTHADAVACINAVNNKDLTDGNIKAKVKARLSNPMPKTQAVKGGMCGGFKIGRAGSGVFQRFGRGFGREGHNFNWNNFNRGRGFYQRGGGQYNRMSPNDYGFGNRYDDFPERQITGRGGRRGSFRGGYHVPSRGGNVAGPSRSYYERPWHAASDIEPEEQIPFRRNPFPPGQAFNRPFTGRHFDDPYFYNDGSPGMKRPFYLRDPDPDYMEPRRLRPRLDYSDPAVPFPGTRYHDNFGADTGMYSQDYYGSDYGAYPSYYGANRPYRRGYY
ncbi:putative RNA binding protein [Tripterygium wilfordii]|uniref:Putative RNA binding protein n=2 Tax=Tripterygium wilfordii TaxID=458696 RepID=A0A7J7CPG1_TRIWF|nr:putative RNA binding protein [Tripterygium wilfordii]